jgi:hypothetical protein
VVAAVAKTLVGRAALYWQSMAYLVQPLQEQRILLLL